MRQGKRIVILVRWNQDTHVQLPGSTAIRQRAIGDEDLLPDDFAQGLVKGGLADIIGDESNVPSCREVYP